MSSGAPSVGRRGSTLVGLLGALGLAVACASPPGPAPAGPPDGAAAESPPSAVRLTAGEAGRPATAEAGMVSAAHPAATAAGVEILAAGGNAFDAAVAVAAALNVAEPEMSGIGGYGTIVVWPAEEGRARFLNASGRIPRSLDPSRFRPPTPGWEENRRGALAVSTPGNVNAWEALHRTYGSRPWAELFAPAVRLAEGGVEMLPRSAGYLERVWNELPPRAHAIYGRDGRPLAAGETLVQADLGASLRRIAEEGAAVVHGGELGLRMVEAVADEGGSLALSDLAENEAAWWETIEIDYRGHRVVTAGPPATAFPSLLRLGLMSRWEAGGLGHNSPDYLHRFAEATKIAFWHRLRWAGDPEVAPPPLERLLAPGYWAEQVATIDLERARSFEPPGVVVVEPETPPAPDERPQHTTHFVVADRWGNVVSATQTLGNIFGSRILVPGTGIWLNNSLAYSTFEPAGNPMDAFPGRHKLSGDCPTLVLADGRPWAALGTPGGHTIGQTVPQMVMNLVDFRMGIQEALEAGRVAFLEPDFLAVEERIAEPVREELARRGHDVDVWQALGNAHGLTLEYGPEGNPVRFTGGADDRGDGVAQGVDRER